MGAPSADARTLAADDVPADQLPLALARAHRALAVGAVLERSVLTPAGAGQPRTATGADGGSRPATGGRGGEPDGRPPLWPRDGLSRVVVGGGFTVESTTVGPPCGPAVRNLRVRARRERTLPATIGPGMRLLVCGLNPSLYAADAGVGFARPGNRFWPAALAAGLVSVDRDPLHALVHHGLGMTDLVKRATVSAAELQV